MIFSLVLTRALTYSQSGLAVCESVSKNKSLYFRVHLGLIWREQIIIPFSWNVSLYYSTKAQRDGALTGNLLRGDLSNHGTLLVQDYSKYAKDWKSWRQLHFSFPWDKKVTGLPAYVPWDICRENNDDMVRGLAKINHITHAGAVGWVHGGLPGSRRLCYPSVKEKERGNCHTATIGSLGELSANKTANCLLFFF